jgi:hypothetical protein
MQLDISDKNYNLPAQTPLVAVSGWTKDSSLHSEAGNNGIKRGFVAVFEHLNANHLPKWSQVLQNLAFSFVNVQFSHQDNYIIAFTRCEGACSSEGIMIFHASDGALYSSHEYSWSSKGMHHLRRTSLLWETGGGLRVFFASGISQADFGTSFQYQIASFVPTSPAAPTISLEWHWTSFSQGRPLQL